MNHSPPASFEQQYEALRSGCAVFELADWSSVTLTGADRQSFLNNFCTNDVKRLAPGESCEAFFTNVKGRILGHGMIACREHELVLVGVPGQASRLIEHLDRYLIREDVQLRDSTAERRYALIAGGVHVRDFFDRGGRANPTRDTLDYIAWNLVGSEFAGLFELTSRDLSPIVAILGNRRLVTVESAAFNAARIEAGVPLFGTDFDENNFPQEVGRESEAISFIKGCYLGQETVARIDALGHVNQRIVGVRFFGGEVPAAGTEMYVGDSKVGRVTSGTFSPRFNSPLALAMVRREANATGTQLSSPVGQCEVVALPPSEPGL